MEKEVKGTVSQSLDAIKASLRTIEQEFSNAIAEADKAWLLLQMRRLGEIPSQVEESPLFKWRGGPAKDNGSNQIGFLSEVMRSKRSDLEYVRGLIDEVIWLIANGRIGSGKR